MSSILADIETTLNQGTEMTIIAPMLCNSMKLKSIWIKHPKTTQLPYTRSAQITDADIMNNLDITKLLRNNVEMPTRVKKQYYNDLVDIHKQRSAFKPDNIFQYVNIPENYDALQTIIKMLYTDDTITNTFNKFISNFSPVNDVFEPPVKNTIHHSLNFSTKFAETMIHDIKHRYGFNYTKFATITYYWYTKTKKLFSVYFEFFLPDTNRILCVEFENREDNLINGF